MDIKKPRFDNPRGLGTTGKKMMVDATMVEIKPETRVVLVYQGKDVTVHVTGVVKPD